MKGWWTVATFASALGAHLDEKPKLSFLERRLKKILDAKPSKRRTAILQLMEARARDRMGFGATEKIDWSAIDWAKILDFLLKLLAILGPLLV